MKTSRQLWTEEEDLILADIVLRHEEFKWAQVSQMFSNCFPASPRTAKQCRERWNNYVDPNINKTCWSSEEKMKIYQLQKVFGNKWAAIAKQMKGRTENSVKNYFYSDRRKEMRRRKKEDLRKLQKNQEKVENVQEYVRKGFKNNWNSQESMNFGLNFNAGCHVGQNQVKMEDNLVTLIDPMPFFSPAFQIETFSETFKDFSTQLPYFPFFSNYFK